MVLRRTACADAIGCVETVTVTLPIPVMPGRRSEPEYPSSAGSGTDVGNACTLNVVVAVGGVAVGATVGVGVAVATGVELVCGSGVPPPPPPQAASPAAHTSAKSALFVSRFVIAG
jgi:hypothetical protein